MSEQHLSIELNPAERRLYDRLRACVVDPESSAPSSVRDLLLFLPDLVVLLVRLLRDPEVPRPRKWVAALGLGYVLSPVDLMPGLLFGPLGLLDDLLVVSATLSHLVKHVHPDRVRAHWPENHPDSGTAYFRWTWAEIEPGRRISLNEPFQRQAAFDYAKNVGAHIGGDADALSRALQDSTDFLLQVL